MLQNTLQEKVTKYRRDLHQIPEIGFDLYKTHDYIKTVLLSMGYQPRTIVKTGLIVHIKGERPEAVAFRADMDALTINEETLASYQSVHPGNMHACGHDGHMAMLLGLADVLKNIAKPKQSIVLLFQPAEEGPSGAQAIVEEGLLSEYNITKIFGLHLNPDLEEGKIGLTKGVMMSQNSEYDCVIKGKSAHAAKPEEGLDAMEAAFTLAQNFRSLSNESKQALVNVGTFNSGEARNSVAGKSTFTGTIRSFSSETYKHITTRMQEVIEDIKTTHKVMIDLTIKNYYPPVINDAYLYDSTVNALNKNTYTILEPMMLSEDFSFYQQAIPGLFMMLGSKNESMQLNHPLHSARFNFNESILMKGIHTYIKILTHHKVLPKNIAVIKETEVYPIEETLI